MSYFKKNMPKKIFAAAKQYLNEIWPVSKKSLPTPGVYSYKSVLYIFMKILVFQFEWRHIID